MVASAARVLVLAGVVYGFGGATWSTAASSTGRSVAGGCRVTIPNGSTPPGERASPFTNGNGRLWTGLPLNGRMVVSATHPPLPGTYFGQIHAHGSISEKFWWWGARSAGARLTFTGTRLDARAGPLRVDVIPSTAHSPHFWATRLTFASAGCWRVTGRAGAVRLSFVLAVSTASP